MAKRMTDEELEARLRDALRRAPRRADVPCPSLEELVRFIQKRLPSAERARVDAHLATCHRCITDVARLYRGLKREGALPNISGRSLSAVWLSGWGAPAFKWAVAAVVLLIGALLWQLRRTPSQPHLVDSTKPTPAEARFLAMRDDMAPPLRSGWETPVVRQPHLTVILSQTPELQAEAADSSRPFAFQVDEVNIVSGGFDVVKADAAQTKDKPVNAPSLKLTKPLERGKVYRWRVSAGEGEELKESEPAFFMVAEARTADAARSAQRQYARSPLRLAKFYTAHGLYLDALDVLDRHLSQSPSDPEAQEMRRQIEGELNTKD